MEKIHPASLLIVGQIQNFAQEEENKLIQTNTGTATTVFLAMIAILNILVCYAGELMQVVHWNKEYTTFGIH